jgi:hypothetical protein
MEAAVQGSFPNLAHASRISPELENQWNGRERCAPFERTARATLISAVT